MTLRTRLALWFACLLALLIAMFSMAVFALMWLTMVRAIDSTLEDTADFINANSTFAILPVSTPGRMRFHIDLPEIDFVRASGIAVQVWVKDGDTYTPVDASANIENYPEALDHETLDTTLAHAFSTVDLNGTWWRVHTNPIMYDGVPVGSIQVAQSLEIMYVATRSLLIVVIACAIIAIIGAVIISRWLARRLLEPVQDLTSAASRIVGASDLSTRLTWSGPNDELGRLIAVFNRMMERLQNVFSIQQRFVADISHELRTPLTGILGNVDLMRRYGADEDSLNAIHADTARMSRLVHDLLMLARADYGGTTMNMMPLDVDSVVSSAVKSVRLAAEQKGLKLSIVHLEPLRVMGDPQQLKQLLDNLIANAMKFTATGGTISLNVQQVDQSARIEVVDTGIGIAAEHQARIFDRFYQVDTARAQDGSGGFGLGLSVARWIAEAHHGSIDVRSQLGAGATFTVHLPLVQAFDEATQPARRVTQNRVPRIRITASEQPSAASEEQTASSGQRPAASEERPVENGQRLDASEQGAGAGNQQPESRTQWPAEDSQ